MTTGKKILTNYRLSSLITRLRKAAQYHERHDMIHGFSAGELDEVADVLVDVLNRQSPTQGSGQ